MSVSAISGALVPVFFVLLLGYTAGKAHLFNADQASGVGKVALSFALPAALFVGMSALLRSLLAALLHSRPLSGGMWAGPAVYPAECGFRVIAYDRRDVKSRTLSCARSISGAG